MLLVPLFALAFIHTNQSVLVIITEKISFLTFKNSLFSFLHLAQLDLDNFIKKITDCSFIIYVEEALYKVDKDKASLRTQIKPSK